ncbi:MAG: tRNA (5-methylaminomethyl-2-thiouridine)(34)-methyltransferase MnmD, partial [Flavobacteriaceae bacterium]|nr:tRNA (5-methylaminomethyl-2-thiouridine)(34)-methyltransferase MnmD [Flavobacteriaceae bacterium]
LDTEPNNEQISILEMGFGSGLNAILTFLTSQEINTKISYTGIEAFPLSDSELKELDYGIFLNLDNQTIAGIYDAPWNKEEVINQNFLLHKIQSTFQEVLFSSEFNIIYFDAFGPRVQPELWTEDIFIKMFRALKPGGILTTYCSKGDVRRTMIKVGFNVEKIPGPPGKREMLRAIKPC